MSVDAQTVKKLREMTSAGFMDCKKALTEANGDLEVAVDWLRKKGLSAAAKKAGRQTTEGGVAVLADGTKAVMVEVNTETDFVAKNDNFHKLISGICQMVMESGEDIEKLKTLKMPGTNHSIADELTNKIAVIGENMSIRRATKLEVKQGVIGHYMHNTIKDNICKIGVLVALESEVADKDKLQDLGKKIAMHIAASRPEAVDAASINPALVEKEKNLFREQAKASGKPDNIIEKMVEGRVNKFLQESTLLEQPFVMDGKTPVKEVIAQAAKEFGGSIEVKSFIRFELGEGMEKKESNFAEEVAAATKGH